MTVSDRTDRERGVAEAGASLPRPAPRGRRGARLAVAVTLLALAVYLSQSYIVAFGWAVIIVISVWPLYVRLRARMPSHRLLAPLIVTVVLAVALSVPVVLILVEIGREGQAIVQWVQEAQAHGVPVPAWVQNLPLLGGRVDAWWQSHLGRPHGTADLIGEINVDTVTSVSRTLGGEVLSRILLALLTFIAVFVLLRDGDRIANRARALAETWLGAPGERLEQMMALAVRQTVNGTLLVAIGEGVVIGAAYVLAGVPHAALFAILTAAFAMLPLGAWFAFGAAALALLFSGGSPVAAALVAGWGAIIMMIGDNFVQPALIGGSVRLPFLWAMIGILGGLETFGLIGLFLGPVIMASLLMVWREWITTRAGDGVASDPADPPPA